MNELEQQQRTHVVAVAKSWLGTPYRNNASMRGPKGGVDCAHLPAAIYLEANVLPPQKIEHYSPEWHLHRGSERYLEHVQRIGTEIPEEDPRATLPGNLVLWRFGRCYSHGAIIVSWPKVVHAFIGVPCGLADAEIDHILKFIGESGPEHGKIRPRKFFSPWGDA